MYLYIYIHMIYEKHLGIFWWLKIGLPEGKQYYTTLIYNLLLIFSLNHLSLDLIRFSFCRMWEFCRRGTWWRTMNRAGLNIFNDHFLFFLIPFAPEFCCATAKQVHGSWGLRCFWAMNWRMQSTTQNSFASTFARAAEPQSPRFTTMATRVWTFWPRPTRPDAQRSRWQPMPIEVHVDVASFHVQLHVFIFQIWMSIWGWSLCGSLGIFCRIQLAFFPWLRVMEIQCSWHSKKGLTPRICQLRLARGKVRILHCVNTLGIRLNTFPDSHGISECVLPWVGRPVSIPLVSQSEVAECFGPHWHAGIPLGDCCWRHCQALEMGFRNARPSCTIYIYIYIYT